MVCYITPSLIRSCNIQASGEGDGEEHVGAELLTSNYD